MMMMMESRGVSYVLRWHRACGRDTTALYLAYPGFYHFAYRSTNTCSYYLLISHTVYTNQANRLEKWAVLSCLKNIQWFPLGVVACLRLGFQWCSRDGGACYESGSGGGDWRGVWFHIADSIPMPFLFSLGSICLCSSCKFTGRTYKYNKENI